MKELSRTTLFALLKVAVILIVVQAARAALTMACTGVLGVQGTVMQPVTGLLAMAAVGSVLFALARIRGIPLSLLPRFTNSKDRILYIIATVIVGGFILAVPLLARDFSLNTLLSLLYTAIVTPIFEEVLFRGYAWNRLKPHFKVELTVCMVTAAMYAIWNLGYIDFALTFSNGATAAGIIMLLVSNAMLGLIMGLIMGIARILSKNCYPSILLHIVLCLIVR